MLHCHQFGLCHLHLYRTDCPDYALLFLIDRSLFFLLNVTFTSSASSAANTFQSQLISLFQNQARPTSAFDSDNALIRFMTYLTVTVSQEPMTCPPTLSDNGVDFQIMKSSRQTCAWNENIHKRISTSSAFRSFNRESARIYYVLMKLFPKQPCSMKFQHHEFRKERQSTYFV